ncbi:MAG: ORF6N domain-containing protein [Pirellulaceae bacterium]
MLDRDLAGLYEVPTKALNQAVKRNETRFPEDFTFRLTKAEVQELNRSQIVTGSQKHRDPRYPPYAFTEQGVAMLSSVLRSERAAQVNVEIVRTFVRLRKLLSSHKELAGRLDELETKYDAQFKVVFNAIRQLMEPPTAAEKKRGIGFHSVSAD